MTRETKIGLLVGLGFIVVFAVLLSHNGANPTQPGPAPRAAVVPAGSLSQPQASSLVPPVAAAGDTAPAVAVPAPGMGRHDPSSGTLTEGTGGSDLPTPIELQLPLLTRSEPGASGQGEMEGAVAAALPREQVDLEAGRRVAPPVVAAPAPTVRQGEPIMTAAPADAGDSSVVLETGGDLQTPTGDSHAAVPPAKPHTIKKGETLVSITRAVYNDSSPKVIEFLAEANKIKDPGKVFEGQTLMIPPLPPDLQAAKVATEQRDRNLRQIGQLVNEIPLARGGGRRAPEPVRPDGGKSPGDRKSTRSVLADSATGSTQVKPQPAPEDRVELIPIGAGRRSGEASPRPPEKIEAAPTGSQRTNRADKPGTADKPVGKDNKTDNKSAKPRKRTDRPGGGRWYEIQPNDTFSSIAQRHLGSSQRWSEIKDLNKDVDPARMKPGMRIRLPAGGRESMSVDASSRRDAA
ncbi:MAG: LysM peptidoglycan-binding domain-containing protein [Phycisphaerae bacterium]|jgi:nucleoid-associated protein YgaU